MKRVVIPLDRSERSEVALRFVPVFCEPGDELYLLSVDYPVETLQQGFRPGRIVRGGMVGPAGGGSPFAVRPPIPAYSETKDQTIQRQLDEMQDYLLSKVGDLENAGFTVEVSVEISEHPEDAILELVQRTNPAFILMARTTHHSLGARIFGTVVQHVIRANLVPVIVLPVPDSAA